MGPSNRSLQRPQAFPSKGESLTAYSVYVHNAAADIIVHCGTNCCAHAVMKQQCRACGDLERCCPVKQVLVVLRNDILPARRRARELNVCPYHPACSHTELGNSMSVRTTLHAVTQSSETQCLSVQPCIQSHRARELNVCPYNPACSHTELGNSMSVRTTLHAVTQSSGTQCLSVQPCMQSHRARELNVCPYHPACSHTELASQCNRQTRR